MKQHLKNILLIVVIVLISTIAIIISVNIDFSDPSNLDKYIINKMNKAGIPGMSVAFLKDDKVISIKNYGYADVENKKEVSDHTIFQIASVSKLVTATAVMQLYEKGMLGLEDDINMYLPFKVSNPLYPDIPITVKMLLNHTSSIDNNWETYDRLYTIDSGGGDSPITLDEFLRGLLVEGGKWYDENAIFTKNPPGNKYKYSNPGYALLGYIVQNISKMKFDEYCQENIFNILGMEHSKWLLSQTEKDLLAVPYSSDKGKLPFYSFPSYPDGALKTSTKDFSKFMLAFINNGIFEGKKLLDEKTVKEMVTPSCNDNKQALAWNYSVLSDFMMQSLDKKGDIVGHTGVLTISIMNPAKKTGLIVFCNQDLNLNLKIINTYFMIKRLIKEADVDS